MIIQTDINTVMSTDRPTIMYTRLHDTPETADVWASVVGSILGTFVVWVGVLISSDEVCI